MEILNSILGVVLYIAVVVSCIVNGAVINKIFTILTKAEKDIMDLQEKIKKD